MIHICLCDDNSETLKIYSEMLKEIAGRLGIPICQYSYSSGEQLVFKAEDQIKTFDKVR